MVLRLGSNEISGGVTLGWPQRQGSPVLVPVWLNIPASKALGDSQLGNGPLGDLQTLHRLRRPGFQGPWATTLGFEPENRVLPPAPRCWKPSRKHPKGFGQQRPEERGSRLSLRLSNNQGFPFERTFSPHP